MQNEFFFFQVDPKNNEYCHKRNGDPDEVEAFPSESRTLHSIIF